MRTGEEEMRRTIILILRLVLVLTFRRDINVLQSRIFTVDIVASERWRPTGSETLAKSRDKY